MSYVPKHIDDFKVGDFLEFTKTVTETDVVMFAGIVNDFNPLHMDDVYAKTTMFGSRIAHGALVESYLSGVAGQLLGMGSIHVSHTMTFPAPTRIGDTITARAEVKEIIPERRRIVLYETIKNQDGVIVAEGETIGKVSK